MFDVADMPPNIAALPRDHIGRPVPWFVDTIDGKPDFRVMSWEALRDAVRFELCWVCGKRRGRTVSFVLGPMCAVNRNTAEPPCHRDCAVYSARFCPFLSTPRMVRRERNLPADYIDPPGEMIRRNPGVALVWTTRTFTVDRRPDGLLFTLGEPTETLWFAQGRPATHAEVMASIESGTPLLRDAADQDGRAAADLDRRLTAALALVPAP